MFTSTFVEVIGVVQPDFSIKELQSFSLGNDFGMFFPLCNVLLIRMLHCLSLQILQTTTSL